MRRYSALSEVSAGHSARPGAGRGGRVGALLDLGDQRFQARAMDLPGAQGAQPREYSHGKRTQG